VLLLGFGGIRLDGFGLNVGIQNSQETLDMESRCSGNCIQVFLIRSMKTGTEEKEGPLQFANAEYFLLKTIQLPSLRSSTEATLRRALLPVLQTRRDDLAETMERNASLVK
jgi:hypothetical protein